MRDERHWLIQHLGGWRQRPALIWRDKAWSHDQLCDAAYDRATELLQRNVDAVSTPIDAQDIDRRGHVEPLETCLAERATRCLSVAGSSGVTGAVFAPTTWPREQTASGRARQSQSECAAVYSTHETELGLGTQAPQHPRQLGRPGDFESELVTSSEDVANAAYVSSRYLNWQPLPGGFW